MKHHFTFMVVGAVLAGMLSACGTASPSDLPVSSAVPSSTPQSTPAPTPSSTPTPTPTPTPTITFYSSVHDIPNVDIDYWDNRNGLTKNGTPWFSAPGTQQFGDLCFTDGKTLYIQCFISRDSDDFRWFYACFDHFDDEFIFPEETENKLFTHADGYTLYTDDGFSYTISPCRR
jgi:hypothetical protein